MGWAFGFGLKKGVVGSSLFWALAGVGILSTMLAQWVRDGNESGFESHKEDEAREDSKEARR